MPSSPSDRPLFPLPIEIEDIDCGWLTAALRTHAAEATVRAFEVLDVRRGTCTKLRLRLDLNEAGRRAGVPERVILKAGFEPHSRDMGFMHEIEVRGYRDVLPTLELPGPACYFADYDPDRRQGVILMEDLTARGVAFCDALAPATYDAVARRLSTLAAFHARTWSDAEQLAAGRWGCVGDYLRITRDLADHLVAPDNWVRFIASPRGAAASVRFHDPAWMMAALERLVVLADRLPHAVLHGDTHPGNLYVDTDGTPGFFDPTIHRGPGMAEVSYHLVCALDQADRPRWERALIGHYLAELARHGVEAPSLDDAMAQYGAFLARAYFIFVINDSAFQPEAVNTAYVARISAAMVDHDTLRRLEEIR